MGKSTRCEPWCAEPGGISTQQPWQMEQGLPSTLVQQWQWNMQRLVVGPGITVQGWVTTCRQSWDAIGDDIALAEANGKIASTTQKATPQCWPQDAMNDSRMGDDVQCQPWNADPRMGQTASGQEVTTCCWPH